MSCLNSWLRFDQINMKPLCNESDKIDAEKKLCRSLVDCMAPGHTVSSLGQTTACAGSEGLLEAVLEWLLWSVSLTRATGQFTEHDNLWEAMIFQSGNMTSPSELVLQDDGFDAGNLSLLQDFNVDGSAGGSALGGGCGWDR